MPRKPNLTSKPRLPMTTERFLREGVIVHGDRFDYSLAKTNALKDKVTVVCRTHGPWETITANHLRGAGCPECAGNKKYTYESFVAQATSVHKGLFTYLKCHYKDNKSHMRIVCKVHGEFQQKAYCHLQGQGCPKCDGKGMVNAEVFAQKGREINGDKFDYSGVIYKDSHTPTQLKCNVCGHKFKQSYNGHIRQKQGCPKCAGMLVTLESFIESARKVHGERYDYSKTTYFNSKVKTTVTCRVHGDFTLKPNSHLGGTGCAQCYNDRRPMSNEEYIRKATEAHNGKYSYGKTEYTRSTEKVIVTCPEHGDWEVQAQQHMGRGTGCPCCGGVAPHTNETFINAARDAHGNTYTYGKVKYTNHYGYVTITCKKHGDFEQGAGSHLAGRGCPTCGSVGPSKAQMQVTDFLSQHIELISEHRLPDSLKRFDIFVPERNLAIEYNGLYWHSSRTQKKVNSDFEKLKAAEELGIRVLTIFEDEWQYSRRAVENTLLSAIGKLPKIHARKCEVLPIDRDKANTFYNIYHLQGSCQPHMSFGLFHNQELVASMSFSILRSDRNNMDKRHWELVRYAATASVVGGASKLLKAFVKTDTADNLTSYSDIRAFSGNMYEKLGFTMTRQSPPDYMYATTKLGCKREHKSKYQKKNLVKLFPGCDVENKTEKQICEENGLYQIFDCGKRRWDLTLTHARETEPAN
jgi:hypothetical protein